MKLQIVDKQTGGSKMSVKRTEMGDPCQHFVMKRNGFIVYSIFIDGFEFALCVVGDDAI